MFLCKIGVHEWDKWHEAYFNTRKWFLPKKEERECHRCHDKEIRDMPPLEDRIIRELIDENSEKFRAFLIEMQSSYGMGRYSNTIGHILSSLDHSQKQAIIPDMEHKEYMKWCQKRQREILKKHRKGMSMEKIAVHFDITKQRVWQIVHREELKSLRVKRA